MFSWFLNLYVYICTKYLRAVRKTIYKKETKPSLHAYVYIHILVVVIGVMLNFSSVWA